MLKLRNYWEGLRTTALDAVHRLETLNDDQAVVLLMFARNGDEEALSALRTIPKEALTPEAMKIVYPTKLGKIVKAGALPVAGAVAAVGGVTAIVAGTSLWAMSKDKKDYSSLSLQ